MKNKLHPVTKLGAIAAVCVLGTGLASAATTYSKGGMQTTHSQTGFAGSGLPMLAPGVQELSLGGFLNWSGPTAYGLNISYGRFVTSNVQVGVLGQISGVNSDNDYRLGIFGEYNFLTGTAWVPYVRATGGYANPNQGSHSLALDLDGGVKYFMRPNIAIYGEIGGGWVSDGTREFNKQLNVGMNFYF
jgi:hypothetical protein